MPFFRRVPRLSKPFVKAAILDAAAMGILLGAINPFAGVITRRLGAGPFLLGFLSIAPFIGFLSAGLISRMMYRVQWGRFMAVLRILSRLPLLAMTAVSGPVLFVGILACLQILTNWSKVLFGSMTQSHVYGKARPSYLKWVRITMLLTSVPCAFAVGLFLDEKPSLFRMVFPAVAFLSMVMSLYFFKVPSRNAERKVQTSRYGLLEELSILKKDRRFLFFMLAFFVGTFAEKIVVPINPIYFVDVLDLKYSEVGLAQGIVGPLLSVAGYFFWGNLLEKFRPITILIICMLLKAVRPVLWALAGLEGMPTVGLITAGAAVFNFMIAGLEISILLSVLRRSEGRAAPMYLGIHYFFLGVRGLLGPMLGVAIYQTGLEIRFIYWMVAAIVLVGTVVIYIFSLWEKNRTADTDKYT